MPTQHDARINPPGYQDLVTAATRYHLGETSAEVQRHVGWLILEWSTVTRPEVLIFDIASAITSGRPRGATTAPPAWPEYSALWAGFLYLVWAELEPAERDRMLQLFRRWQGEASPVARLLGLLKPGTANVR